MHYSRLQQGYRSYASYEGAASRSYRLHFSVHPQNNSSWSLVSWKLLAEFIDLIFGTFHTVLCLDDRRRDLTKSWICKSYNCYVFDLWIFTQEILDLYRINILTTADDNILLTVNQIDEAICILLCHISGIQPSILNVSAVASGFL